jgi:peptidoglycan/LPS O-acetylase OafA/YrhL
MNRVIGLDSIRFVLAFIVVLSHGVVPVFGDGTIEKLIKLFQPTGIAAVMGFFIISGFVIHYPYSTGVNS